MPSLILTTGPPDDPPIVDASCPNSPVRLPISKRLPKLTRLRPSGLPNTAFTASGAFDIWPGCPTTNRFFDPWFAEAVSVNGC